MKHRIFGVGLLVVVLLTSGCAAAAVVPAATGTGAGLTAAETVVIITAPVVGAGAAAVLSPPTTDEQSVASTATVVAFQTLPVDAALDGAASKVWSSDGTRGGYRIAHIDDSPEFAKSVAELLLFDFVGTVTWYESCERLLNDFRRFDLYIVDGNLPGINGPTCAVKIAALHPGAVIVGDSASERMVKLFVDTGFKAVWSAAGYSALEEVLRSLGFK